MEALLRDLEQLAGVEHGCIYYQEQILASTLPAVLNANLATMGRILEQAFNAVSSIGKSHNEIYFEFDENYLVGYRTNQGYILLLLTSRKINFSLIHVSVQSAAREIALSEKGRASAPAEPAAALATGREASSPPRTSPSLEPLRPRLSAIQTALTLHLGPIAQIVFDERLSQWQLACEPTAENIPRLLRMLSEEIPDERERVQFLRGMSD